MHWCHIWAESPVLNPSFRNTPTPFVRPRIVLTFSLQRMRPHRKQLINSKARTRRIFWRRVRYGSVACVVLASILVFTALTTRTPLFNVKQVAVSGNETVPEATIHSIVDAQLAGAYAGIVPRRFLPTIPTETVKHSLEELPRVKVATVTTRGRTLSLTITEYAPHILWCHSDEEHASVTASVDFDPRRDDGASTTENSTDENSAPEACFYVDEDGVAYESAPELRGGTFLRFVDETLTPTVGARLLDDTARETIVRTARTLEKDFGFIITRISFNKARDIRMDVQGGGVIFFPTAANLEEAYSRLSTLLSAPQYKGLRPGMFQYIDVRFAPKVFVKRFGNAATTTSEREEWLP
jgi:hypothetical protein